MPSRFSAKLIAITLLLGLLVPTCLGSPAMAAGVVASMAADPVIVGEQHQPPPAANGIAICRDPLPTGCCIERDFSTCNAGDVGMMVGFSLRTRLF